jgi:hypothetical protein
MPNKYTGRIAGLESFGQMLDQQTARKRQEAIDAENARLRGLQIDQMQEKLAEGKRMRDAQSALAGYQTTAAQQGMSPLDSAAMVYDSAMKSGSYEQQTQSLPMIVEMINKNPKTLESALYKQELDKVSAISKQLADYKNQTGQNPPEQMVAAAKASLPEWAQDMDLTFSSKQPGVVALKEGGKVVAYVASAPGAAPSIKWVADNKPQETWETFETEVGGKTVIMRRSSSGKLEKVAEGPGTAEEAVLNPDGSLDTGGFHYTKEMLENYAQTYGKTGKMPSLGMKAGPLRKAILYYHGAGAVAAGKSGADVAADWMVSKGQEKSVARQRTNLDAATSFISNINKQASYFTNDVALRLKRLDTRALNIPINQWEEKFKGSPDLSTYKMLITEISAEVARLSAGNPQSIAELSASAREKWENIHDLNLSPNDMIALINETVKAANMRYDSLLETYQDTVRGAAKETSQTGAPARPREGKTHQVDGRRVTGPNGQVGYMQPNGDILSATGEVLYKKGAK